MEPTELNSFPKFDEFLWSLFEKELINENIYDPDVVAIVKEHLGQEIIHSRAGNLMANDLVLLAKERSDEVSK